MPRTDNRALEFGPVMQALAIQHHPDATPVHFADMTALDDFVLEYLAPIVRDYKPNGLDNAAIAQLLSALLQSWMSIQTMPCIEFLHTKICKQKQVLQGPFRQVLIDFFGPLAFDEMRTFGKVVSAISKKASQTNLVLPAIQTQCMAYLQRQSASQDAPNGESDPIEENDDDIMGTKELSSEIDQDVEIDEDKQKQEDYDTVLGGLDKPTMEAIADDTEILLDRLYDIQVQKVHQQAQTDKDKASAVVPHLHKIFHPPIPKPLSITDHATLLDGFVDRLTNLAFADGDGLRLPKENIRSRATEFVSLYLKSRTFAQLVLLEQAPRVMIGPEYLKQCGFEVQPTTEQSFTYLKWINVPTATILSFSKHSRTRSRMLACDTRGLLDTLKRQSGDEAFQAPETLPVFHIGRVSNGITHRRQTEKEELRIKAEVEGRCWAEAVKGGKMIGHDTAYVILADHSHLAGIEWSERAMYNEIFFSLLFVNPLSSNTAWPGGQLPPAPLVPATISRFSELGPAPQTAAQRYDDTLLQIALNERQVYDKTSWACLKALGYRPSFETPQDFINQWPSRTKSRSLAVCTGMDAPFKLPFTYTVEYTIMVKLFIAISSSTNGLIVRPAGVTTIREGISTKGPLSAHFLVTTRPSSSPVFEDIPEATGTLTASFRRTPGSDPRQQQVCLFVSTAKQSGYVYSRGQVVEPMKLQAEALGLLFSSAATVTAPENLSIVWTMENHLPYDALCGFRQVKRGSSAPPDTVIAAWQKIRKDIQSARASFRLPVHPPARKEVQDKQRVADYLETLKKQEYFVKMEGSRWDLTSLSEIDHLMGIVSLA